MNITLCVGTLHFLGFDIFNDQDQESHADENNRVPVL